LFVVALNPSFAGNLHHPPAASAHFSTLLRKIEESSQAQVQVCMITNSRYGEEEKEEEEEEEA
jgi:DNA-binding LacI/PurR family transcriptional regulator